MTYYCVYLNYFASHFTCGTGENVFSKVQTVKLFCQQYTLNSLIHRWHDIHQRGQLQIRELDTHWRTQHKLDSMIQESILHIEEHDTHWDHDTQNFTH